MSRLRKIAQIPGRELDPVGGRGLLGAHARHLVPAVSKSKGHGGGDTAMQLLEGIKVRAVRTARFGVGRSAARGSGPAAEQAAHPGGQARRPPGPPRP